MIQLKNKVAIMKMETAGLKLAEIMIELPDVIKEGVTTLEINQYIDRRIKEKGLISRTKGYHGYKHASCISINEQVVHGVPSEKCILSRSDLVKIDICAAWNDYSADLARCFFVGEGALEMQRLVSVTQASLDAGIEKMRAGNKLSDISAAIQKVVEGAGFGVVRDFAGHGIGKRMHEEPEILNYGNPGKGPLLQVGMVFALEPMVTYGNYQVHVVEDGWTVETIDKSWAAHVEDTVVLTVNGPKIITRFSA